MKKNIFKKASLLLMSVLIAAMTLCSLGCGKAAKNNTGTSTEVSVSTSVSTETSTEVSTETSTETSVENTAEPVVEAGDVAATEIGEGNTAFTFVVIDGEGNETTFNVHTDEATVGAALVKVELIAGEESEYGLYVKVVNGITADWNVDGHYWAFYINGEYAMTGVDATDITEGSTYTFKVE